MLLPMMLLLLLSDAHFGREMFAARAARPLFFIWRARKKVVGHDDEVTAEGVTGALPGCGIVRVRERERRNKSRVEVHINVSRIQLNRLIPFI